MQQAERSLRPPAPADTGWLTSRLKRLHFELRACGLRWRRALADQIEARRHAVPPRLANEAPVDRPPPRMAFVLSENETPLWTQRSADEWLLTAGKVHNLRIAAARLDGLVVRAGQEFSFWHAVGRPTRRHGYTNGRELREGCLVASIGGGLCQLSNALYAAALDAGAVIVERHAHSRLVPGSAAEAGRDATVFWNYLDLRLRLPVAFEIEARLDAQRLVVRLRGLSPVRGVRSMRPQRGGPCHGEPHDCLACVQRQCVERIVPVASAGCTALLMLQPPPEFAAWLKGQIGTRAAPTQFAWRERWHRLRGASAPQARAWADTLGPEVDTLIVPLELLAPLHRLSALGGRRYSVLITRMPLAAEHAALHGALRLVTTQPAVAARLQRQFAAPVELLEGASPAAILAPQR